MSTMANIVSSMAYCSAAMTALLSSRDLVIPQMAWERQLQDSLSVTISQLRFVLACYSAVAAGWMLRFLQSPFLRHVYALVTGLFLVLYPFGHGVIQVVPPLVLTYLAMMLFPRHCRILAWLINFPYLVWLHAINASGMSWNEGELDFVGGCMTLVLKLISLASCYHDSFSKSREGLSEYQREHLITRMPNLLEYLSYVFSFGNLLAGPYIEYRDYSDFIQHKQIWSPQAARVVPSGGLLGLKFLGQSVLFLGAYVYLEKHMGLAMLDSKWYKSQPLLVRLLAQAMCGYTYQMKYYLVWKLSEASLTLASLNFEKWTEDGQPVWGRYCNARFLGYIMSDSARSIPRHWNICTGKFLRRYVYERVVPKGRKPAFVHLLITQLVSAFWHGVYPGYLIFFLGSALYLNAATVIYKMEQRLPTAVRRSLLWHVFKVLWTNVCLNYMALAFVVLEGARGLALHRDVYFMPHIIMVALFVVGLLLPAPKPTAKQVTADAGKQPPSSKEAMSHVGM